MARRKRPPEPEHWPDVEAISEPVRPEERLDPRLFLFAPEEVQSAGDEAVIAWAEKYAPGCVLSDEHALARRRSSARAYRFQEARMEARREGRPLPTFAEFFGDD